MKRVEKAINLKHTPEEQRYLPRVNELEYLYDQIGNLPFSLMCAAFDFGFEQGSDTRRQGGLKNEHDRSGTA